ncbi:MAG TPA: glycosyltransferase family 39 protein [Thermoanaerobaculia bacterium]
MHLDTPPQPLAARERLLVLALSLGVALTRWVAVARTLWDWDEALFVVAMRDFDVSAYHPHPPGFPLFIALAKLVPLGAFHALQCVAVLASLLLFPAAFFLARELRLPTFVCIASALLLAFSPNVWLFGGTAFSDIPSLVLSLVACALLLRGCRSDRALLLGCVALGVAAGIRPQNLLIAAAPLLLAFLHRRRTAVLGALITATMVMVSYGIAAELSGGIDRYRATLASHARYIRSVDSFRAPLRPSLLRVADDFFVRPFRAPAINLALTLLALAGLMRRRAWLAAAIFGPFLLFAWLTLDFHSTSRFSIAYMPLFAIFAAEGLDLFRRARTFALAAVLALLIVWTLPALLVVHRTAAPPAAAAQWIRAHAGAQQAVLFVDPRLGAHAAALLGDYTRIETTGAPAVMHARATAFVLRESSGALQFVRTRERLEGLTRPRYFEVSIERAPHIVFGDGWYGEEGPPHAPFRWMARSARALLPVTRTPRRLTLRAQAPSDTTVEVRIDGRLLERFATHRGFFERQWTIGSERELTIVTSASSRAPGDARELGLRVEWLLVE